MRQTRGHCMSASRKSWPSGPFTFCLVTSGYSALYLLKASVAAAMLVMLSQMTKEEAGRRDGDVSLGPEGGAWERGPRAKRHSRDESKETFILGFCDREAKDGLRARPRFSSAEMSNQLTTYTKLGKKGDVDKRGRTRKTPYRHAESSGSLLRGAPASFPQIMGRYRNT